MFHLENFLLLISHFNFLISCLEFLLKYVVTILNIYSFLFEILLNSSIFFIHFFITDLIHCFSIFGHLFLTLNIACHFVDMFIPNVNSLIFLVGSDCFCISYSLGSVFLNTFYLKLFLHNRPFKTFNSLILNILKLFFNCWWIIISLEIRTILSISFLSPKSAGGCSTHLTLIIRWLSNSYTPTHATCLVELFVKVGLVILLTHEFFLFLFLFKSIKCMWGLFFVLFYWMLLQFFKMTILSSSGGGSFFLFCFSFSLFGKNLIFLSSFR